MMFFYKVFKAFLYISDYVFCKQHEDNRKDKNKCHVTVFRTTDQCLDSNHISFAVSKTSSICLVLVELVAWQTHGLLYVDSKFSTVNLLLYSIRTQCYYNITNTYCCRLVLFYGCFKNT